MLLRDLGAKLRHWSFEPVEGKCSKPREQDHDDIYVNK